ncbi:MAG TPA: MerR family transcriptional regulator [Kribbella sp.]
MPDSTSADDESLRRRLKDRSYLRPIDLARAVGLGVTQIRTYEQVGFLPPAERGANGYRRYSQDHAEALRVARVLIAGYGWQSALEVMRAVHHGESGAALALVNSRHAALDLQRGRIYTALEAIDVTAARPPTTSRVRRPVRIKEAARTVGVRSSAVRFWEQQGLLRPARESSTGYRVYDADQLRRLNVVALLRDVGYQFDAIREVLDDLAGGRRERTRQVLEERLEALDRASWQCIAATSALHGYLTARNVGIGGVGPTFGSGGAGGAPE